MPIESKEQSHAKLINALQQIKEIAESALVGQQVHATRHRQSKPKEKSGTEKATLRGHALKLRDEGFFKLPRTTDDIHKRLQTIYPCHRDRVITALWRMVKSRELRKTLVMINKQKLTAYVW